MEQEPKPTTNVPENANLKTISKGDKFEEDAETQFGKFKLAPQQKDGKTRYISEDGLTRIEVDVDTNRIQKIISYRGHKEESTPEFQAKISEMIKKLHDEYDSLNLFDELKKIDAQISELQNQKSPDTTTSNEKVDMAAWNNLQEKRETVSNKIQALEEKIRTLEKRYSDDYYEVKDDEEKNK